MRETKHYTTGSKEEFLHWIPEVGKQIFDHFNVLEISLKCFDKEGNKSVFTYREGEMSLSPEYDPIFNKKKPTFNIEV